MKSCPRCEGIRSRPGRPASMHAECLHVGVLSSQQCMRLLCPHAPCPATCRAPISCEQHYQLSTVHHQVTTTYRVSWRERSHLSILSPVQSCYSSSCPPCGSLFRVPRSIRELIRARVLRGIHTILATLQGSDPAPTGSATSDLGVSAG